MLSQRSYNQAANVLQSAVKTDPLLSEARYYLAIALLSGKKPRKIDEWTIRDIEENLDAATRRSSNNPKYYALWAIVKYGFYTMNGFIENAPTSIQLFSLGERIQSECAQEILYHLNDYSNPYWLNLYHKFGKTH